MADISQTIFLNAFFQWNVWISIKISLKLFLEVQLKYKTTGSERVLAPARRQAIVFLEVQ